VVIGRGRLIADTSVDDFVAQFSERVVLVRTPQPELLIEALAAVGGQANARQDGALMVNGAEAPKIGEVAALNGIVLHELSPQRASLEEAFMELTRAEVQFNAPARQAPGGPDRTPAQVGGAGSPTARALDNKKADDVR
jgi:ABC-2 type transport system ATP-binding protein